MKKFWALICMITCIFGLTACGGDEQLSEYNQQKVDYAKQLAAEQVIPMLEAIAESGADRLNEYTADEVEYQIGNAYSMNADGYAVINGASSFESALKEIGSIVSTGEPEATIDGNEIIVLVPVDGVIRDAEAEIILSNDMFLRLESAALNPQSTMGVLMVDAALNTVIGMGTVFAVLILISAVISAFRLIPKIQKKFAKKTEAPKAEESAPAAAPVVEEVVEETDDYELVAVIAAAIAASEGAVTTDGFVVRSIRKRRVR